MNKKIMTHIVVIYIASILASLIYLNLSDTFSMRYFELSGLKEKVITTYVVVSLFFSPLLFMISDAINSEK
ncbi:hypothetical protein B4902_10960 [Yersinia frederiksenii]|nr:hypothetical protein B4902_10960 [Yersinia frederiksenii]